jgi:hypothetical protein
METIDTIITNAQTLANAPINWSLDAGPIWLVMMVLGSTVVMGIAWVEEAKRERRNARLALYRRAERMGVFRGQVRDSV